MIKKLFCLLGIATLPLFCQERLELSGNHLDAPLMERLIRLFNIDTLVETGTYVGGTAELASDRFKEVHTVELSPKLWAQAQERFKGNPKIHCYQGHSGEVLSQITTKIQGRVLFWLDAHWSGGETALGSSKCPIREELAAIRNSGLKDAVILIDDIRCFHGKSEEKSWVGGYPSVQQLKEMLPSGYALWILGDIAIAYPQSEPVDVSPLVKACTVSRFSNSLDPWSEGLLAIEKTIQESYLDAETQVIEKLCADFASPKSDHYSFHYLLWKGLLHQGRREFSDAARCFERVIYRKYRHPRLYWYLAQACYAGGEISLAQRALDKIIKAVPKFQPARQLQQAIRKIEKKHSPSESNK